MKLKILFVLNSLYVIAVIAILFGVSIFWLGSKEDHEQAMANNPIGFFFSRLTISLTTSLGFAIIIFIVNLSSNFIFGIPMERSRLIKISLVELVIFTLTSMVFVLWFHS
jgi:flagellar basal body-associated protein FliL